MLIAVPAAQTVAVASIVVGRGVPVYIEKPLAADVVTGAKLVEDILFQGIPAIVGENFSKQARFPAAAAICSDCQPKSVNHIRIMDTLRRGARTSPRTDEELFVEHSVHAVSACRSLTGSEVTFVNEASRLTYGSSTEVRVICETSLGTTVNLTLTVSNEWSRDSYLLALEGADTAITHSFDFDARKYTDVVSHFHGTDELVRIVRIPNAECGIRRCWDEFKLALEEGGRCVSPSLVNSLNDIQVREAMILSLRTGRSIPITPFEP